MRSRGRCDGLTCPQEVGKKMKILIGYDGLERPDVASTILVTPRLALPAQLIEVKFVAKV